MRGSSAVLGFLAGAVIVALLLSGIGGVSAAPAPSVLASAAGPGYNVTFSESGLPSGTNWSVHLAFIGCGCSGVRTTVVSPNASIVIPAPNGSYRYKVFPVLGYYVVGPSHGLVNVTGAAPAPVSVVFAPVVRYAVEFTETGLPAGTAWTVSVSGNGPGGQARTLEEVSNTSRTADLNLSLINATYHYTVSPVNGSFLQGRSTGRFVVDGAAPAPISVVFVTPLEYPVTFSETGLLAGLTWTVQVNGRAFVSIHERRSSAGSSDTFYLPNGTFEYRIGEVLGYGLAIPSAGPFSVAGGPLTISVPFEKIGSNALFLVDFNETGLASGTQWSVHITAIHTFGRSSHATVASTGSTASFALANGTYRYRISEVTGYTLATAEGTVTVTGAAPPAVAVSYTAIPTYAAAFNETGLPNGTAWSILVYTQQGAGSVWPIHLRETGNSSTISFNLPNGTYCYRIYPVHGWKITTGSATGSFVVAGASPAEVSVTFSATR